MYDVKDFRAQKISLLNLYVILPSFGTVWLPLYRISFGTTLDFSSTGSTLAIPQKTFPPVLHVPYNWCVIKVRVVIGMFSSVTAWLQHARGNEASMVA